MRFDAPADLAVTGDRALLVQALFNIIRNAVEAVASGFVAARAERRRGRVRIDIDDTGPGIPAADLERVFDPFVTTKTEGLGVGLFLSRKIIEAHDGVITAGPRPGGGTRVRIELPGGRT